MMCWLTGTCTEPEYLLNALVCILNVTYGGQPFQKWQKRPNSQADFEWTAAAEVAS